MIIHQDILIGVLSVQKKEQYRFNDAEIDFLVNPKFAGLLDYSPVKISKKVLFEREKLGKIGSFIGASMQLRRELRRGNYDLVIDFQGLFRSAFFSFLAGANRRRTDPAP